MQDVVGLGGSAGSIEALKMFFSYMPEDSELTFVVVTILGVRTVRKSMGRRSVGMQT